MAKSHEAWYRLKVQAIRSSSPSDALLFALFAGSLWWNSARLHRLCHGWMGAGRQASRTSRVRQDGADGEEFQREFTGGRMAGHAFDETSCALVCVCVPGEGQAM